MAKSERRRRDQPAPCRIYLTRHSLPGLAAIVGSFVWAYWQTLGNLARQWWTQPDYSHGFLVLPLALMFLWVYRREFPGLANRPGWLGIGFMALAMVLRTLGALLYIEALEGWSILVYCAGGIWLLGGWPLLRWSWPSVLFLFFMVPLPFSIEHLLTLPLQRIATIITCSILQCLGQPALSEGNTIWLGEHHLQVEEACAGLRIFVGVIALAFAHAVFFRGPRWDKAFLIAAAAPIAILANALRIVGTGRLYQHVSGEMARTFSHEAAGWVTILLSAGLLIVVAWYWRKLFPEVSVADVRRLVRDQRGRERQGSVTGGIAR